MEQFFLQLISTFIIFIIHSSGVKEYLNNKLNSDKRFKSFFLGFIGIIILVSSIYYVHDLYCSARIKRNECIISDTKKKTGKVDLKIKKLELKKLQREDKQNEHSKNSVSKKNSK